MSKSRKPVASKKAKSNEEKYQKVDQHQHILLRPDMYIGSCKEEKINMWIYDEKAGEDNAKFIMKEISYVPGLYKIFDEILVNARDHVVRCREEGKELCSTIKVTIDRDTGRISVWNNGEGIPVEEHKEHKVMIPSMIFGELLSGTNYDDTEQRKVGGTNGLGAKLCNVYSTEFEIETVCDGKKFYQKFKNNMYDKDDHKVSSAKTKKDYTCITFVPDYAKFGLKGLSKDIVALFKKRVYDIAMNSGVKVHYNDEVVTTGTFTKYVDNYFEKVSEHKKVFDINSNPDWKVCVVYDPTDKMEHQQISFANGICTSRGGTHVNYVTDQIINKIREAVVRKVKGSTIKPSVIRENLIVFVDACIINPNFDSQTKEFLKTKVSDFGSSYTAPAKFLSNILKTGVVDQIIANIMAKEEANIGKGVRGKNLHYPKLYDAHYANKKQGDCTLILTEGDSAKTFALSGLNVVGRNYYGVFPLKGKVLNVRTENPSKVRKNEEIKAIMDIIGLDTTKKYTSTKGLRYGHIMVLADQDYDGSHIKGLVMNFIHHFWPELLKNNEQDFLVTIVNYVAKASKGTGAKKKVVPFMNLQALEEWKEENNGGKGWNVKYYKGLGTSTGKEAQECFEDIDSKIVHYHWQTEHDDDEKKKSNKKSKDISHDAMILAFSKDSDPRKDWVNSYDPTYYIDTTVRNVSFYDFIHKELIAFSVYNTVRAIPNIMDGFKPGQRKVYFACVKKGIYTGQITVSQLAGYVAEVSDYHHGPKSLEDTIIKIAQNFVGNGNNINLLVPDGQFGSRLCGGKDHASSRYIHTFLNALGKKIFREEDMDILSHQYAHGSKIEPKFYAPIIPMILVNGSTGIGSGYSSHIPSYNPIDIIENVKRVIKGLKPKEMVPWARHYTGSIERINKNRYLCHAKWKVVSDDVIEITDLALGTWTDNYKEFMMNLLEDGINQKKAEKAAKRKGDAKTKVVSKKKSGSKATGFLKDKAKNSQTARVSKQNTIGADIKKLSEDCTDIRIKFIIQFHPGKLAKYLKDGTLAKNLKLVSTINLTNMHLFDANGKIRKYSSIGSIIKDYVVERLIRYDLRKEYLLGKWKNEIDMLKWKLKFVEAVIAEEIAVFKKTKSDIIQILENEKYPKLNLDNDKNLSYNYLTSMEISKFTTDEVEKLRKLIKDKKQQIKDLESKSSTEIWLEDLDELSEDYLDWSNKEYEDYYAELHQKKSVKGAKKGQVKQKILN